MGNKLESLCGFCLEIKSIVILRSRASVCARVCNIKESVCRTDCIGNFEIRFTYVTGCTHKKIECASGTPGITYDIHISFVFPLSSFYNGHLKFVPTVCQPRELAALRNTFANVVNCSSFNCGSDNNRYL